MIQHLETLDDYNSAIKEKCVIKFTASWCGPCKRISPLYKKLSEEHTSVKFYEVDIDEGAEISDTLGIKSVPTFLFFVSGEQRKSLTVTGGKEKELTESVKSVANERQVVIIQTAEPSYNLEKLSLDQESDLSSDDSSD